MIQGRLRNTSFVVQPLRSSKSIITNYAKRKRMKNEKIVAPKLITKKLITKKLITKQINHKTNQLGNNFL